MKQSLKDSDIGKGKWIFWKLTPVTNNILPLLLEVPGEIHDFFQVRIMVAMNYVKSDGTPIYKEMDLAIQIFHRTPRALLV